jgi:cytochrome P450
MAVMESDLDLTDPRHYRSGVPHELFTALRGAGPVHRHPTVSLPGHRREVGFWSVVCHDEIQRANRDWETFSAFDGPGLAPTVRARRGHMIVSMDPPSHTRVRRLISAGFTPRMITELEGHIARRTTIILDGVAEGGEDCEFVSEVAYRLPMHVIADIIGIPEEDRPWVFHCTDLMMKAADPASGLTTDDRSGAEGELFEYARHLGQVKRQHPDDDIWSTLIYAVIHDEGGNPTSLSELELDMFFLILALAGSETTRNAISQGLLALLDHPDQLSALRADRSLLPRAAEEMIRWASPVLYFGRTATRDVELGGARIGSGDRVVLWYPSGNRDEATFDQPFDFDIRRDPNPHVSFGGGGPHYCLGANLARKEVQVMTGGLLDHFGEIQRAGPLRWSGAGALSNVGASLERLPVRLLPR